LNTPTSYDLREELPGCISATTIFDQGSCGGCWALSTAGTLSDRYCLKDQLDLILSPQASEGSVAPPHQSSIYPPIAHEPSPTAHHHHATTYDLLPNTNALKDLLDCVEGDSNGCSGGFTEDGFDYTADEGLRTVSQRHTSSLLAFFCMATNTVMDRPTE
jgi:hypothetical protein